MIEYSYVLPDLYKVDAQTVGRLCEKLQQSKTGLTPDSLVAASRDERSPTHALFEWRDDVAAELYRKEQARQIIKNLVVTRREILPGTKERGFVCTPGGQSVYVTLDSALSNETWKAHLLQQAKADMEIFTAKYHRLLEIALVIDAMRTFLKD